MTDTNKIFKEMIDDKIADYGVFLTSWTGLPGINTKISFNHTADFFMSKLEEDLTSKEEQLVIEMTSVALLDRDEVILILRELCDIQNIDREISLQKWRCYLLNDLIRDLDPESFYSLIMISEFWMQWQNTMDVDIPHTYQGVGNTIPPEIYYSQDNISRILRSNLEWVAKEREKLMRKSTGNNFQ